MTCELCRGPVTKIEAEYQDYWIAYCRTCNVLMAWSREHIIPSEKRTHLIYDMMLASLKEVADRVYGVGNYQIDRRQRTIQEHMHIHARPR